MNTYAVAVPRADSARPLAANAAPRALPAPGELLYRFEADLEFSPIGLLPEGLRVTVPFEGRATAGRFAGARVWGIDHFLLRADGVGLVDAQKTLSLDGGHLLERVTAHCLPPAGLHLPPLAALLEPGFRWPQELFPIFGFSSFRTADPELDALNRAFASVEGWVSFAKGRLAIETRLASGTGRVAPPAAA